MNVLSKRNIDILLFLDLIPRKNQKLNIGRFPRKTQTRMDKFIGYRIKQMLIYDIFREFSQTSFELFIY